MSRDVVYRCITCMNELDHMVNKECDVISVALLRLRDVILVYEE